MTFRIQLVTPIDLTSVQCPSDLENGAEQSLSPYDELVHILAEQCRTLSATAGVSFIVGGFGQDPWPLDIETDLAVALEQLPVVLDGLKMEGKTFQLNFYEQGIERYLTGVRYNHEVRIECASMSLEWTPDPSTEILHLDDAESMFNELRDRYIAAVEKVCPELTNAAAFKRWRDQLG